MQQLQQQFEAESEVSQARAAELNQVQRFEPYVGQVAGLDQKPKAIQVDQVTAHQVAQSVEFEMDPTRCSFRSMDP